MLGPSGVRVLEFYIAHSLPINGLIVLYAALLLGARLNLRRIEQLALAEVRQQLEAARQSSTTRRKGRVRIPGPAWPELLARGSRFPLVAAGKAWYPRPATAATVEKLLPLQALVDHVLAERKGAIEAAGPEN